MQTARPTSSTHEQAVNRATVQRTRRWETTYSTVNWDYPPSPAAYYNALLARGASHSRFLRIAYSTTRERSSPPPSPSTPSLDTPTSPISPPQLPSILPHLLSRPYANTNPRSGNPPPHTLKRRKPHWPKPPQYHASLLRSPLSRRKGLFRAVLAPNKAVDFVRWDIFACASSFSNQPNHACTSLRVAECVLEPYEAAAGFSGWHGLGIDITRRVQGDDECPGSGDVEPCRPAGECGSDLRREIDEATVDEGRARWACLAEELVGPPGIALRFDKSGKGTAPLYPAHSRGAYAHEEVRWDPDIGSSSLRPPRATPAPDEKRRLAPSSSTSSISGSASGFKPQLKMDSPSAWWYPPSSHRGPPPHLHSLRFPHTPHVQYGPPPLQFSPYFPGRLASVQGHGDWYSVQPTGAPSVNRDPNPVKSHPPHSHSYTPALTPIHVQSSKCPRRSLKSSLGRDEDESGHDCDKETETDHDYDSTTTTTDSDPPPHTPIGAVTTSHCVEVPQLHGDDKVGIDADHGSTTLKIGLSDPNTPVKLLPRFATPPSVSSSPPDLSRVGHGSSKAAVVFPSLNGSFRQQMPVFSSNQGISTPTMPARVATTASLTLLSSNDSDEDNSKMPPEDESLACSPLHDNPAFMLRLSSPPPTSPGSALRKDSQGFWEPVTPISPCSSLSSLPLSPSEGKSGARPTTGRIGGNTFESPEANDSQDLYPTKCRSLSPGPRRETSVDSSLSSSSRPTAFSSPTSTPASMSVFGGSYPCSPSNGAFLIPPNPTTLLPAFLATTGGKRKKASRTREIVDQLRSSSIDAGKGVDDLGWLAGAEAGGEPDGTADKAPDHPVENHVAGQPSPLLPPKSRSDSGFDLGKNHGQAPGSRTCDSSSRGSGEKSNGTTTGPETSSPTNSMTPFPILSVSQTSPSNLNMVNRKQTSGTSIVPVNASDGSKTNATITTSPNARSQLLSDTPNGGTSPSTHHSHHPLPSPTHPTVHLQPVLGPPVVAVAAYPPPVYVPYTQYSLAPPPQQQGGWVAIYPGRPAHIPVHPIPHITHITGGSGMRHVSW